MTNRDHLTDGPTTIPAWQSCERCQHFAQRAGMPGGDCMHAVAMDIRIGTGARYISRTGEGYVVTPKWCPVREGM